MIHDADTHDFGAYNCSVVNEYGVARKQIRLNEESEYTRDFVVMPIFGGIGVGGERECMYVCMYVVGGGVGWLA